MATKRQRALRKSYRTAGALQAARFKMAVNDYMADGRTKAEAERLALQDSEAWDVVIQNPDGTFSFYEPEPGAELTLLPGPPVTESKS